MIIQNAKLHTAAQWAEPAAPPSDAIGEGFADALNIARTPASAQRSGETKSAERSTKDDGKRRVSEASARSSGERGEPRVDNDKSADAEETAEDVAAADRQTKSDQQNTDRRSTDPRESSGKPAEAKVESQARAQAQTAQQVDPLAGQAKPVQKTEAAPAESTADQQKGVRATNTQAPVIEPAQAKAGQATQAEAQVTQAVDPQAPGRQATKEQSESSRPSAERSGQQADAPRVPVNTSEQSHTPSQSRQQSDDHPSSQQRSPRDSRPVQSNPQQTQAPPPAAPATPAPAIDAVRRQFAGNHETQAEKPAARIEQAAGPVRIDLPEAPAPAQPTAETHGSASARAAAPAAPLANLPDIDSEQVLQRTLSGLRGAISQKGGTVNLRLSPPELGTLRIQIRMANGMVQATFNASTQTAGATLNQNLHTLRQALESHGLTVENLQVQVQQPTNTAQTSNQSDAQQSPSDGRSRGAMRDGGQGDRHTGDRSDDQPRRRTFDRELLDLVA